MLVFALDTSTLIGSVGWVCMNEDAASLKKEELIAPAQPGHAETLLPRVEEVLARGNYRVEDINLIAFGRGPGTFTGLRIGQSTVKGLAIAHNIPIIGISSLEALAFSTKKQGVVATVIDARRSELFGALYKTEIQNGLPIAMPIVDQWVGPAKEVIDTLAKKAPTNRVFVTGNGIEPYRQEIIDSFGENGTILSKEHWAPGPVEMAKVGYERFLKNGSDDIDSVEPVYLRKPDAKLPNS